MNDLVLEETITTAADDQLRGMIWNIFLFQRNKAYNFLWIELRCLLSSLSYWPMVTWPQDYKTFSMLDWTKQEISTAHKIKKCRQVKKYPALSLSDVVFIMLINVKMPTVVGILAFMSRIIFVLSWVEHEKSFITSMPVLIVETFYCF